MSKESDITISSKNFHCKTAPFNFAVLTLALFVDAGFIVRAHTVTTAAHITQSVFTDLFRTTFGITIANCTTESSKTPFISKTILIPETKASNIVFGIKTLLWACHASYGNFKIVS